MSEERRKNLAFLHETLSSDQLSALRMVIQTADVQGDYNCMDSDGGSYWCDDVQETLQCLADEIDP